MSCISVEFNSPFRNGTSAKSWYRSQAERQAEYSRSYNGQYIWIVYTDSILVEAAHQIQFWISRLAEKQAKLVFWSEWNKSFWRNEAVHSNFTSMMTKYTTRQNLGGNKVYWCYRTTALASGNLLLRKLNRRVSSADDERADRFPIVLLRTWTIVCCSCLQNNEKFVPSDWSKDN